MLNRLLPAAALLLLLPLSAQARPAPRNVLLSRGRTEPVVAVDPRHPSIVVVGSNTNYGAPVGDTLPTAYFTSHDGGRSFASGSVPVLRPFTTGADPSVAIARNGTVFFAYLGETPTYCSGGQSAVLITHSIDHGRSFSRPILVDNNSADDKPYMAVENVPNRPAHIFLAWTRWHASGSDIWFSRSADGGATFTRPIMLYSSSLDNFGPIPVVGPRGRVYVFWSVFPEERLTAVSTTRIVLRASANDGMTFAAVQTAAGPFGAIPRMAAPGSLRTLPMPAVTVDDAGSLYLAWSQVTRSLGNAMVNADVELSRSTTQGRTWSRPVRINDDRRADRFMPAITAFGTNSVGLAFYDRRASRWHLELYAAHAAYDAGGQVHVSPNVRVTQRSSAVSDIFYIAPGSTCFSPGRFFGDYIGVAPAGPGTMGVVWTDTQLHVYQETDIWFARVPFGSHLARHGRVHPRRSRLDDATRS